MTNTNNHNYHLSSASHHFKVFMVIFLFLLTIFKLILVYYYPTTEIVSDKVLMGVIVAVVVYLWIQALRDRYQLLALHHNLLDAYEQLKQAQIETVSALIKTVEARDPYTSGHSERVTKIAVAIAQSIGLDRETIETINRAGKLHDVGKIGISDSILLKKEQLTDAEWKLIRQHPRKGAEILKTINFLLKETDIILHHHERPDGTGYPEGLTEPSIPLEARIIAVADTFDAMNTKRPYRSPMSREEIVQELKKVSGTQLSPRIVEAFLKLLEKNPRLWENDENVSVST